MNKSKLKKAKKFGGFSLLEVVVAVFVFTLAVVMVAQIFASGHLGFRKNRALQRDLETAQQAINILSKTLRTSVILFPENNGPSGQIRVFDYSRATDNCIVYRFNPAGDGLFTGSESFSNPEGCVDISADKKMTSGKVYGNFHVIRGNNTSNPKEMGQVTISMRVCLNNGCDNNPKNEARLQTTVSLRNWPKN